MFAINTSVAQAGISPNSGAATPDSDPHWNGLLLAADSEQHKQDEVAEEQEEEPDCE